MTHRTFDLRAVKAFAEALGSLAGCEREVRVGGDEAWTNGKVIQLPGNGGLWSEADFESFCGSACHETAHEKYRSLHQKLLFTERYSKPDHALAALCFNAVLDVADEARFEREFARARDLFRALGEECVKMGRLSGALPSPPPGSVPSPHTLLVVGIRIARSRPRSLVRRILWGWRARVRGLQRACRILQRAAERFPRGFRSERTEKEWRRLHKLASELVDLMRQLFPPSPEDGAPTEPTESADSPPGGSAKTNGGANGDATASEPQRREAKAPPPGGTGDAVERGEIGGDDPFRDWRRDVVRAAGRRAKREEKVPQTRRGRAKKTARRRRSAVKYDESCYQQLIEVFRRMARMLASEPSRVYEHGHTSGSRLSRPTRARIDGRCFRRKTAEKDTGGAFALLFDHSGSMCRVLRAFLPVGKALADALASTPGVDIAVWRFGTYPRRLASTEELKNPRFMGGTGTELAIEEATQWLEKQPATSRAVVVFTDGLPHDEERTAQACLALRRSHIRLLVGSMEIGLELCAKTMPGALVFDVDPTAAASSLHVVIRRLLASG